MATHPIFYILSLVIFTLGAVIGLALAIAFFQNKPRPRPRAFMHLALGVTALTLLAIGFFANPQIQYANYALIIFGLVAVGGLTLLTFRLTGKTPPSLLIIGHALGALCGITLLFYIVLHL